MKLRPAAYPNITRRDFVRDGSFVLAGILAGAARVSAWQAAAPALTRQQLIDDLVAANRILADQNVVDGYGHVSVRSSANPQRYLMAASRAPELVTATDIVEFDLDSNAVSSGGGRTFYRERYIHGEIYKVRADVHAVVHNHSPEVISFGVTNVPLRPVYHMAAFIGEGVPVFEIREAGGQPVSMLVDNPARGRALAQTLGNHPATLMRGHGAAVVGNSLPHAVGRCIYLALNAKLQAEAMALGGPINFLNDEEARVTEASRAADKFERAWELWKRKAMAK